MSAPLFASSLSTRGLTVEALREVGEGLQEGLSGRTPDLVVCFASHHHGDFLAELGPRLAEASGAARLLGCTGERIVGTRREIEEGPALAAWAMSSEGTQITPYNITTHHVTGDTFRFEGQPEVDGKKNPFTILLADPFSFPMGPYLQHLNEIAPGLPAIGGMASGGGGPGQNVLFREDGSQHEGAVGVTLEGGIELVPVVSQGCRPVGRPYVITRSEGNLIVKLGGKQAARVLHEALAEMEEADQDLFRRGPFLGLALDPTKSSFERGDFLVRGIMGHRAEDNALAISDSTLRVGMTVQFLVRDAASASEDLSLLMKERAGDSAPNSAGALVFSCNGRGSNMFGKPDHDIGCVQSAFDDTIPAAGFFAMGEIGPVGNQNFLHGFTASIGVIRATAPSKE